MNDKSKKDNKKKKKKWVAPKLVILKENPYHSESVSKVYAQYTGGGSTGTHSTEIRTESEIYVCL